MSTWLMLLLTTSMKFFSFTIAKKSPMFWKEDCAFKKKCRGDHLWRDVHNNLLLQTPAAQRRGDQHFINMT